MRLAREIAQVWCTVVFFTAKLLAEEARSGPPIELGAALYQCGEALPRRMVQQIRTMTHPTSCAEKLRTGAARIQK